MLNLSKTFTFYINKFKRIRNGYLAMLSFQCIN